MFILEKNYMYKYCNNKFTILCESRHSFIIDLYDLNIIIIIKIHNDEI